MTLSSLDIAAPAKSSEGQSAKIQKLEEELEEFKKIATELENERYLVSCCRLVLSVKGISTSRSSGRWKSRARKIQISLLQ